MLYFERKERRIGPRGSRELSPKLFRQSLNDIGEGVENSGRCIVGCSLWLGKRCRYL